MLTSSEHGDGTHAAGVEGWRLQSHLHPCTTHQLREAGDTRGDSERGDGTQPTSKNRGCSQTCTPAPHTAVVAPA